MPIKVRENKSNVPVSVQVKGKTFNIARVDEVWEIDEEWWRERRIARRYYLVTTEGGGQIIIFRDLVGGGWYRQNA